tara:strand:+ start:460 stop:609 length:150 start_codon:yes stop_codon:yes gene_type:complete
MLPATQHASTLLAVAPRGRGREVGEEVKVAATFNLPHFLLHQSGERRAA